MPEQQQSVYTERQLVVFTLGAEAFGVDISTVREIIKREDITKIPNTAEYIEGVINLRGKIVVVIDLAKKLNLLVKQNSKDSRIIVFEVAHNTIGMIVDSCNEVLRLSSDHIESAPSIVKQKINENYLEGVGMLKGRLIILLDLIKLIGDDDLKYIQETTIR